MHGDFSRRTFDHLDGYRAVLLQQGRVLLDADWNEQADIATYHDEVRTVDIVGDSGGPAPAAGATGVAAAGPFAIVTAAGRIPNASRLEGPANHAGRYYVGGVLAESSAPPAPGKAPDAAGWPLTDQPHLPRPGLDEPTGRDRIALYLDVWQRQVTFDEDPALLESALGGPTPPRARRPCGRSGRCPYRPDRPAATCASPECAVREPDGWPPSWPRRTRRRIPAGSRRPAATSAWRTSCTECRCTTAPATVRAPRAPRHSCGRATTASWSPGAGHRGRRRGRGHRGAHGGPHRAGRGAIDPRGPPARGRRAPIGSCTASPGCWPPPARPPVNRCP